MTQSPSFGEQGSPSSLRVPTAPKVGDAQGRLPAHLALEGDVVLLDARLLEVEGDQVDRRDGAGRVEAAAAERRLPRGRQAAGPAAERWAVVDGARPPRLVEGHGGERVAD